MKTPKGFSRFLHLARSYVNDSEKRSHMLTAVRNYAKTRKHLIQDFGADLQTLIHLLRDWGVGLYRNVPTQTVVLIVAALLYFLSPLDTIPDFLGAVGFTDDAAVVLFVINAIRNEISRYREWQSRR